MLKDLQEYYKIEGRTGCEEILGNNTNVNNFSEFYNKNTNQISLAKSAMLLEFCTTNEFTSDQLKYYRMGLDQFVSFLSACSQEREMKQKQSLDALQAPTGGLQDS